MNKIRVLHLITRSIVGGSQDNTFSTCELHNRQRYKVHLACNPDGQWLSRAREAADVFHPIPTLVGPIKPVADLQALFAIMRLIQREKFEVVHTHTAKAGFLGRLAARVCRVPIVVHTYHAFPWHSFMPAWQRAAYILLERACRPLTDYCITVSENERIEGRWRKVLDWNRSETVYSGIDFLKLDRPVDLLTLRQSLTIPERSPILLTAGRLDPQKAPELMVEAFSHVVKHHPTAILLIAGDGELRTLVETTIKKHGLAANVRLLGFRNDLPALLQLADVFTLCSRWEGMGRAMTEAMLLGKPVVVPAINGIPEIVKHGSTGRLYEAGHVTQLAHELCHVLKDPHESAQLGARARERTRPLFSVQQMVAAIERVYERMLIRRAGAPAPSELTAAWADAEPKQSLDRAA